MDELSDREQGELGTTVAQGTVAELRRAIERGVYVEGQSEAHRGALRVLAGRLEALERSISEGNDGQAQLERWHDVAKALLDQSLTGPTLGDGNRL